MAYKSVISKITDREIMIVTDPDDPDYPTEEDLERDRQTMYLMGGIIGSDVSIVRRDKSSEGYASIVISNNDTKFLELLAENVEKDRKYIMPLVHRDYEKDPCELSINWIEKRKYVYCACKGELMIYMIDMPYKDAIREFMRGFWSGASHSRGTDSTSNPIKKTLLVPNQQELVKIISNYADILGDKIEISKDSNDDYVIELLEESKENIVKNTPYLEPILPKDPVLEQPMILRQRKVVNRDVEDLNRIIKETQPPIPTGSACITM
jgi:hypothetical protein